MMTVGTHLRRVDRIMTSLIYVLRKRNFFPVTHLFGRHLQQEEVDERLRASMTHTACGKRRDKRYEAFKFVASKT